MEREVKLHNDDQTHGRWFFRGRDANGNILLRSSNDVGGPMEGKPKGYKRERKGLHRVKDADIKGTF